MVAKHPAERRLLVVAYLGLAPQLDRQLRVDVIVPEVVLLEQGPVELVAPLLDLLRSVGGAFRFVGGVLGSWYGRS